MTWILESQKTWNLALVLQLIRYSMWPWKQSSITLWVSVFLSEKKEDSQINVGQLNKGYEMISILQNTAECPCYY